MYVFSTDIRQAIRALLKTPAFTAVVVFMLAMGIGANTAMFSVIEAVLLRPLPFPDPERLVSVWSTDVSSPGEKQYVSSPDLADFRSRTESFEGFSGLSGWFTYDLSLAGDVPERVKGIGVDGGLLTLLQVPPALGRVFRDGDDHVVVLTYALWERRFDASPAAVGRSITMNGETYTVIGVMPAGFRFPLGADPVDLWLTWDFSRHQGPAGQRDARLLEVMGRLRPGVPLERAQAELESIAASLRTEYPATNEDVGVGLASAADELTSGHRRALLVLLAAVGAVLLVTCGNVANLLLAKATTRHREMAVRAALGATRKRITAQLMTESLLLSLTSGALGCLLALWGIELILALDPGYLPGSERIGLNGLNGHVLSFTLLISVATGIVFGLAPAWLTSRLRPSAALHAGESRMLGTLHGKRFRGALVVLELAPALMLLTASSLLVSSFYRLRSVDPGLDPEGVLTLRVSLPYERYDAKRAGAFFASLKNELESLPGIRAASAVFPLPFNGDPVFDSLDVAFDTRLVVEGRSRPPEELPRVDSRTVQPDYFRAMGVSVVRGRDFDARDAADAPRSVIINESLARQEFPAEEPLGRRIAIRSTFTGDEIQLGSIVGVVRDVKHRGLGVSSRPEVYVPLAQEPFQEFFVVVKASDGIDPMSLAPGLRETVLKLDGDVPIFDVRTLEERVGSSLARPRFDALVLAIFSLAAVAVAMVGLGSVVSYGVAARTREIGLRMALGARAGNVLKLVLTEGLGLLAAGLALGCFGAWATTRFLESLLFEVSAVDPATFLVVVALFAVVSLLAMWLPARRAAGLDPVTALRAE